jgi:hypothetical protein
MSYLDMALHGQRVDHATLARAVRPVYDERLALKIQIQLPNPRILQYGA